MASEMAAARKEQEERLGDSDSYTSEELDRYAGLDDASLSELPSRPSSGGGVRDVTSSGGGGSVSAETLADMRKERAAFFADSDEVREKRLEARGEGGGGRCSERAVLWRE